MTKMRFKRKFLLLLFLLCAIVTEVGARDVYFLKPSDWGNVEVWVWGSTVNADKAYNMSRVYDRKWWTVTIPDDYTNIAIYDPNERTKVYNDLTIPSSSTVYYNNGWLETRPMYLYTERSWSVYNVCIWGLGDGNDLDVKMNPVAGKTNYYSCYVPNSTSGTIFHNANQWGGTNEIAGNGIDTYFVDGKGWMTSDLYKIVGDPTGGWDVPHAISMTFNSQTLNYEFTVPNDNAYGKFKFIVSNGSWQGKNITINGTIDWTEIEDKDGQDISINASTSTRVIEINPANNKFRVVYHAKGTRKIYYYNNNAWANVYIWAWPNDRMYTMSKVAGTDWWYECEIAKSHTGLNFQDWPNQINPKIDANGLSVETGHHLTNDREDFDPNKDVLYYIDDYNSEGTTKQFGNGRWGDRYKIAGTFLNNWTGDPVEMSFMQSGYSFSYTIPNNDYTQILFVGDNGWIGNGANISSTTGDYNFTDCEENPTGEYHRNISIQASTGSRTIEANPYFNTFRVKYAQSVDMNNIPESADPVPYNNDIHFGPEDVISFFSEYYGNISTDPARWSYPADRATYKTFGSDGSNGYLLFSDVQSCGISDGWKSMIPADGTFNRVHLEIYPQTNLRLKIYPEHDDADGISKIDKSKISEVWTLNAGEWNTITIDLTSIPGLVYDHINALNFQVLDGDGNETTGTFAVDNVYFWRTNYRKDSPATTDCDVMGLNWTFVAKNEATHTPEQGAKDYVKRVFYPATDKEGHTKLAVANEAHDWDVNTSSDTERGQDIKYYVLELDKQVWVSDVELIWGNGYPSSYKVYLASEWPIKNHDVDNSKLGDLLYEHTMSISYAPYYDTHSNLNVGGDKSGRFVVIKLEDRGNEFFGYALKEAHVGFDNEDYKLKTGVGAQYIRTKTGINNMVTNQRVFVTNSRGAEVLKNDGAAEDVGNVTVSCSSKYVTIINKPNGLFDVWASAPGEYVLSLTSTGTAAGTLSGVAYLSVTKEWTNSVVQGKTAAVSHIEEANQNTLETTGDLSLYEPSKYTEISLTDGKESIDTDESRWSSGSWYTQPLWPDNEGNKNGPEWAIIDLEREYSLTDLEIIWEEAYAKKYEVYGFRTLSDAGISASDIKSLSTADKAHIRKEITPTAYANNLIMQKTTETRPSMFPYNDINTSHEVDNVDKTMTAKQSNQARYLLLRMTERVAVDGKELYTGYSIWEVYASGNDVTDLNAVGRLEAPDMTIKVGETKFQSVTAKGTDSNGVEHTIDKFRGATLTIYSDQSMTESSKIADTENNSNVKIKDRADGTFSVEGLKEGTYYVSMEGKNGYGYPITGSFKVTVQDVKGLMAIDPTRSDFPHHIVYDDGYYSKEVLIRDSRKNSTSIDLRSVDFSNEHSSDLYLPAPWILKAENGHEKMNPNVIYYVPEPAGLNITSKDDKNNNVGANVAKKSSTGVWHIPSMKIWDGWDFEPIKNDGGHEVDGELRFYTSLTAGKYSFLVLPFLPDINDLNDKQIYLYHPKKYDAVKNEMVIDKLTSVGSGMEGKPYIVSTTKGDWKPTPGTKDYTVSIKMSGHSLTMDLGRKQIDNLECDGYDIYFQGTYTYDVVPKSNNGTDVFWFDGENNNFEKVEPASSQDVPITPFYAYMTVTQRQNASGQSLAKPTNGMKFVVADEDDLIVTSIKNLDETKAPDTVYTVGGLKVADNAEALKNLPKGMYIVNGKKIIK